MAKGVELHEQQLDRAAADGHGSRQRLVSFFYLSDLSKTSNLQKYALPGKGVLLGRHQRRVVG